MGSGAVIYVPSFINIGSDVQNSMGGGGTQTHIHGQQHDLISLFYLFKNKESRLKTAYIRSVWKYSTHKNV
jgi:hypothetical protein